MYRKPFKLKPVKENCPFCKNDTEPDYRKFADLKAYQSERGKIFGKDRTGLCFKHQKRVAVAIKRARHLAYLPFVASL